MFEDPIVAEVRRVRDELARAFDYDVHRIFADMRQRESEYGDRLVRQPANSRRSQSKSPIEPTATADNPESASAAD